MAPLPARLTIFNRAANGDTTPSSAAGGAKSSAASREPHRRSATWAESAAVAGLAPSEMVGSAFGLLAAVQSFGNFAASAVAGVLWTLVSPRAAFTYLSAWMLISLATLVFVRAGSES